MRGTQAPTDERSSSDPVSRTFAALADPTRRAILRELALGARTVNDLVAAHTMSQPAISKHLRVLEQADLIIRTRAKRTRPSAINPKGIQRVAAWMNLFEQFENNS
jgi:DNA-binding transcriptional ArsR family regulator